MRATTLFAALALFAFAAPARGEIRTGQNVVIAANETVTEDLYAAGSVVRVDGTVEGDLIVAAGTVEVNGVVQGDVLLITGNARVDGRVAGSVRGVAGEAEVNGAIGEDLVVGGGTLKVAPGAAIGRDVLAGEGQFELAGPVKGDLTAGAGALTLASEIGGDANVTAEDLVIGDAARIGGTLTYRGEDQPTIAPGAKIPSIVRLPIETTRPAGWVSFLYGWLRAIVAFSALGVILAAISPRFARAVPQTLAKEPLKSLGWGVLAILATPLVTAMLFALGAVLGGWWLGLFAAGAFVTALTVTVPAVGYMLGHRVLEKRGSGRWWQIGALVLGTAALTLAIRVPVLGVLVVLATVMFGVGAMLRAGVQLRQPAPA